MSLPRLMTMRANHYSVTYSQDGSAGQVPTYTLTTADIPCNYQDDMSLASDLSGKRREIKQGQMFLIDTTSYALMKIRDRIIIDGINYHIEGLKDLSHLGRVYQVQLAQEQRQNTT